MKCDGVSVRRLGTASVTRLFTHGSAALHIVRALCVPRKPTSSTHQVYGMIRDVEKRVLCVGTHTHIHTHTKEDHL